MTKFDFRKSTFLKIPRFEILVRIYYYREPYNSKSLLKSQISKFPKIYFFEQKCWSPNKLSTNSIRKKRFVKILDFHVVKMHEGSFTLIFLEAQNLLLNKHKF